VDDIDDEPSVDTTAPESESESESEPTTVSAGTANAASYRIGEVATLVGVDAHVLRYWESEFRLKPERSASGQRVYRQTDLARFLRIKSLLHDEGYTIAGARRAMEQGVESQPTVDVARVRAALERTRTLRDRIHEMRDQVEMDLVHR
jgi:DNA-binding transcriptional MerR regulator